MIAVAARRTGFVHVYELVNGAWQETSTVDLPGSGGKHLEMPIEIEDDVIVVGRAGTVSNPSNRKVYVYRHSPSEWMLQAELTSGVSGDNFGVRLVSHEMTVEALRRDNEALQAEVGRLQLALSEHTEAV